MEFLGLGLSAVLLAALLAYVGLVIGALISILTGPLSGGMVLVWIIFVFCAPFLGSLLWFLVGRRNAEAQRR